MADRWYELAEPSDPLTQGDLVLDCPVLAWKDAPVEVTPGQDRAARLSSHYDAIAADVVVMTQACDLAEHKVRSVTLCPHYDLTEWKASWEEGMRAAGSNPTPRAWQRQCDDIRKGFVWNLTMLNAADLPGSSLGHRVVDFHEVYTVPREFLESFVKQSSTTRLRLLPPYREHLSQAFARFYMRVGLPQEVEVVW
jgi:hypothetical protein